MNQNQSYNPVKSYDPADETDARFILSPEHAHEFSVADKTTARATIDGAINDLNRKGKAAVA